MCYTDYLFVLINFFVGFFSDIILNYLSTNNGQKFFKSEIIKSLRPYFDKRSLLKAAVDAGLTVVIVLILCMLIAHLLFGVSTPNTIFELGGFLILCFILGYVADILIEKTHIFGNDLDEYYRIAGAGFWGALALVFSVIISYIKVKIIISYI